MVQDIRELCVFVRHGALVNPKKIIYGRSPGFPLSEEGIKQIHDLSEQLKARNVSPDVIYTSPLLRAKQTAEILSKQLGGAPIYEDQDLIEHDSKNYAGRLLSFLDTIDPYKDGEKYGYWIEPMEQGVERMNRAVERAIKKHPGKTIMFVSHGDPLGLIVQHLLYPNDEPSVDIEEIYLKKGHAWVIEHDKTGWWNPYKI
jgi:probable phosphoglycerate mutase